MSIPRRVSISSGVVLTVYANEIDTNKLERRYINLEYSRTFNLKKYLPPHSRHARLDQYGRNNSGQNPDEKPPASDQPREMLRSIRRSMDNHTEVVLYEDTAKNAGALLPRLLTRYEIMDLFSEMDCRLKSEKNMAN